MLGRNVPDDLIRWKRGKRSRIRSMMYYYWSHPIKSAVSTQCLHGKRLDPGDDVEFPGKKPRTLPRARAACISSHACMPHYPGTLTDQHSLDSCMSARTEPQRLQSEFYIVSTEVRMLNVTSPGSHQRDPGYPRGSRLCDQR